MNESQIPLREDVHSMADLVYLEEEAKKEHSMWEISDNDNSVSASSSFRLGDSIGTFQLQWSSNRDLTKATLPKKSIFGRRKGRAAIGPAASEQEAQSEAQQTISPLRHKEGSENSHKLASRKVSTVVFKQKTHQSKFANRCQSLGSEKSSSDASLSVDSEKIDMKSLMFDEDMVSTMSPPKKKPVIMESQSLQSEAEDKAREEYKNEIMAEVSPWEQFRRRLTISQASLFYQVWKLVEIFLSFTTALIYTYEATFLHLQTAEQKARFADQDFQFQLFFLLSLAILVLLDEHNSAEGKWKLEAAIRKLVKQERFIISVVTLLPLPWMASLFVGPLFCQRLYLVKTLRLKYGLGFLDYKILKKSLHQAQIRRVQVKMKNPKYEPDPQEDTAKMTAIMLITEVMKTLRLIVIIVFLSFFTGSLWFIFSEYIHVFDRWSTDNFLSAFGLDGDLNSGPSSKLTYFAFTTVSTVGLGDLHPRNSPERILCSIVMLFGVMCTTMLMDNFSMMIKRLQDFGKPYDESKQFSLFVGTLQKFNEGQHLPRNLQHRMEQYFHYRWSFNRNLAISTEEDVGLYDELPGRLKTELYVDFLFKGFIDKYRVVLDLGQSHFPYKRKYLREVRDKQADISQIDWTRYYTDYTHDDFLVSLLRELEPIKFNYGKLLLRQGQDPVTEVYFPMRGELQFGYNHQKFLSGININEMDIPFDITSSIYQEVRGRITQNFKQHAKQSESSPYPPKCNSQQMRHQYPLITGPNMAVGLFEMLFSKPAQFSVRIMRNEEDSFEDKDKIADCYFIRQSSWRRILSNSEGDDKTVGLIERFKANALTTFIRRVYQPIREHKQCFIKSENMMIFRDYDKHRLKNQELYNEISKPLGQASDNKTRRKSSQMSIIETRKRSIIITQGINMIASQRAMKSSPSSRKPELASLEDVANLIEAGTLGPHHNPFKQISLLSLQKDANIEEDVIISEEQISAQRKVLDAASKLQVLAANLRLMKKFMEIIRFQMQNQPEQPPESDDTIPQLKAEIASLKEQLQQEKDRNHELMVKLNGEIAQKQKIRKLGSMFSFQDNPPKRGYSRKETRSQNWSQSQHKESKSSDSSLSMMSPPTTVRVQNLSAPPPRVMRKSQFSVIKTQTLKSEVSGTSTRRGGTSPPYLIKPKSDRPLLEIDLAAALSKAGFEITRKAALEDSNFLFPQTFSSEVFLPSLEKKARSHSVCPSQPVQLVDREALKRQASKGQKSKSPQLPEVDFHINEQVIETPETKPRLTGAFHNFSIEEQVKMAKVVKTEESKSDISESQPGNSTISPEPSYEKRIRKTKASAKSSIPSTIQEAGNDEEFSPDHKYPVFRSSQHGFDVQTCSEVESQVGVSQFYNMMDEKSSSSSCLEITDIKAGIISEKETATNAEGSSDALNDNPENEIKVPKLKLKNQGWRISSDEPNQASPISASLLKKIGKS